ncbi:MAG: dihydroorotase [Xanthomonadales bacterium]|nr:dihydroorotase [Xanthomonadales bacterium]
MSLLIRNALIVDCEADAPSKGDVLIEGDRITAIAAEIEAPSNSKTLDAKGQWLMPGLVDLAANVPQGNGALREARAAVRSGVTTLCVPPDGLAILDDPTHVRDLERSCEADDVARVVTIGGLTVGLAGKGLTDMATLQAAGCRGVGNGRNWVQDSRVMRCALRYAADLGLCVFITPRDPWLAADGHAHAGRIATRLGLTGVPAAAETAALARDLALVEDTGVRAHFGPLSSQGAVQLIQRAREAGLPVTADVSIMHLLLTEMDVVGFNPACRVDPPLRTQEDRAALRNAVASGLLMIRGDHCPLPNDAKMAPFPAAEPGASTLPTLLSLGIKLVQEELLTAPQLAARLAAQPMAVLGGDAGRIEVGRVADLVIVDPDAVWRCDPHDAEWTSAGRSTPFAGWEMPGRVTATLVGGRRVI